MAGEPLASIPALPWCRHATGRSSGRWLVVRTSCPSLRVERSSSDGRLRQGLRDDRISTRRPEPWGSSTVTHSPISLSISPLNSGRPSTKVTVMGNDPETGALVEWAEGSVHGRFAGSV